MKVLHCSTHFALYIQSLMEGAERHTHAAFLQLENYRNELPDLEDRDTVTLFSRSSLRHPLELLEASNIFARQIQSFRPDVLHFQETITDATMLFWIRNQGLPRVLTIHDATPHPGEKLSARGRLYQKKMRSEADAIVVHGNAIAMKLLSSEPKLKEKLHVVPHHALSAATPIAAPKRSPVFTFLILGRMLPYKGADILAAAAIECSKSRNDFRVVFAGAGPALPAPETVRQNACLVILDKFLSPTEITSLMLSSDCLVLPYIEASSSGVLAQAMTLGLPAIVSNTGALPEYITDGVNGWLCEPGNVSSLMTKLQFVLDNKDVELPRRQAEALRSAEAYSPSRTVRLLNSVYDSTLQSHRR